MRNFILSLAVLALAIAPAAAAQTSPTPRDTEDETRDAAEPADQAAETDAEDGEDGEDQDGGDALQSGGSASSNTAPRRSSLQQALLACEGLSGSASARCQEQALADHPGE